jgi:UDP-GlcNAc:undecaprenyl-phosphate/decaprenyl-phosphate GlcNAc-1-phosphate transferase
VIIAGALAVAALTTLGVAWPLRLVAMRLRILDHPGPRKIHREAVPYLGGVAVLAGTTAGLVFFPSQLVLVAPLMLVITALGLADDIWHASVLAKLVGETGVAIAGVKLGFSWHLTDSSALNGVLSVIWMVGLSNSFNLLDNMDGLSSTVAATSLVMVAALVPVSAPVAVPLAGAVVGFLIINRPPARMYLGDAGSLMIGFGVALASIAAANSRHGLHSVVLLACPVAVAIFDTSMVIVSRLLAGRPVQLGGKDHFSHRLRLLGWSQEQVLAAAFVAVLLAAAITFLASRYPGRSAWLALPLAIGYASAWVRLLRVNPYSSEAKFQPEVINA